MTAPPGPTGAALGAYNANVWRKDMFGFLRALAANFGDIVRFDLGQRPYILVNSAQHVSELYFKHEPSLRKPEFLKASNRGHWGDGLTSVEGGAWRARRKMLRPAFRAKPVAAHLELVAELTEEMLAGWAPGAKLDLAREFRVLTARLAARQVLDADIEGLGSAVGRSGLLPMTQIYGADFTSATDLDLDLGAGEGDGMRMTRPRAPQHFPSVEAIVDARLSGGAPRGDILSQLVRDRAAAGPLRSRAEVLGEVMQLLFAGHLTFPFCLLNFWRDVWQQGLHAVIEGYPGACEGSKIPMLAQSTCLAILKESMRLRPPAPILYREVDTSFSLGGFNFAPDTGVWVSPTLLHADARYFDAPETFDATRFSHGSGRSAHAAYLPFGVGPRVCVASQQSFFQMALICQVIAHRFELRPLDADTGHFEILSAKRTIASRALKQPVV